MAGRKNPASRKRRSEPRTEKEETKEGKGMDEMGMGMLKWISRQFDNFAGPQAEGHHYFTKGKGRRRDIFLVLSFRLSLLYVRRQYLQCAAGGFADTRSRYHLMLRRARKTGSRITMGSRRMKKTRRHSRRAATVSSCLPRMRMGGDPWKDTMDLGGQNEESDDRTGSHET